MLQEDLIIDLVDSDNFYPPSSPYQTANLYKTYSPFKSPSSKSATSKLQSDYLDNKSKTADQIISPKRRIVKQEDELSPLEDFYSLKNAQSDDEDAKYFYNMFKSNEHSQSENTLNVNYDSNTALLNTYNAISYDDGNEENNSYGRKRPGKQISKPTYKKNFNSYKKNSKNYAK